MVSLFKKQDIEKTPNELIVERVINTTLNGESDEENGSDKKAKKAKIKKDKPKKDKQSKGFGLLGKKKEKQNSDVDLLAGEPEVGDKPEVLSSYGFKASNLEYKFENAIKEITERTLDEYSLVETTDYIPLIIFKLDENSFERANGSLNANAINLIKQKYFIPLDWYQAGINQVAVILSDSFTKNLNLIFKDLVNIKAVLGVAEDFQIYELDQVIDVDYLNNLSENVVNNENATFSYDSKEDRWDIVIVGDDNNVVVDEAVQQPALSVVPDPVSEEVLPIIDDIDDDFEVVIDEPEESAVNSNSVDIEQLKAEVETQVRAEKEHEIEQLKAEENEKINQVLVEEAQKRSALEVELIAKEDALRAKEAEISREKEVRDAELEAMKLRIAELEKKDESPVVSEIAETEIEPSESFDDDLKDEFEDELEMLLADAEESVLKVETEPVQETIQEEPEELVQVLIQEPIQEESEETDSDLADSTSSDNSNVDLANPLAFDNMPEEQVKALFEQMALKAGYDLSLMQSVDSSGNIIGKTETIDISEVFDEEDYLASVPSHMSGYKDVLVEDAKAFVTELIKENPTSSSDDLKETFNRTTAELFVGIEEAKSGMDNDVIELTQNGFPTYLTEALKYSIDEQERFSIETSKEEYESLISKYRKKYLDSTKEYDKDYRVKFDDLVKRQDSIAEEYFQDHLQVALERLKEESNAYVQAKLDVTRLDRDRHARKMQRYYSEMLKDDTLALRKGVVRMIIKRQYDADAAKKIE
ncbi:hypothetical protein [Pseudolactococcus insecticola]|uniref:Uncharacterized protein n=1 Tax=Pseudolactococcus insecticola TaxID=2709158 RepID=A0A6A0B8T8_9LACT|nr:hypothetical protein [Lactococcus insecticola]GFH41256.1 hypothetical protein Hs20B_16540 [Lactococcus insecticola]